MSRRNLNLLRALFVLLGAATMLAAYYVWHKPITAPGLVALGGALLDVLAVTLLFVAAGGVGRWALGFAPLDRLSHAERVGVEGMVGFGVLAWLALGVALAGWFVPPVLWSVLIVALLAHLPTRGGYLRDVFGLLRRLTWGADVWTRFLAGLVAFWLGTALLVALMPPFEWDSLMYHMLLPQRVLESGQLTPYADNHYLGFPQTVEMLFAWAVALFGRDSAAALVHYGAGLLGLVTVGGLVRRHTETDQAAWLAVTLLLAGGSFWLGFTREYVDLAVFALSAGALAVLTTWRVDGERRWLVVMGVLVGLAVGVKYTAGMLAIALGLAVLVTQPRRVIVNGVVLAGVALLAYLPWGLRGWLQYGNPFYPFLFGGLAWDNTREAAFSAAGDGLLTLGWGGVWRMLLLPFVATAAGTESGLRYSFDAGVWLMPLAVLVPLGWRRLTDGERALATAAGALLIPMLIMWIVSAALSGIGGQTRLVIPVFPAFAAWSALGFVGVRRWGMRPVNVAFILRALVSVAFVGAALGTLRGLVAANPAAVLLGVTPPDEYLTARLGTHYAAMQQLDEVLPAGARVLFAFEPRAYYCPAALTCDPDALTDHWAHPLVTGGAAPEDVMAAWRDEWDAVLVFRFAYESFFLVEEGIAYQTENALFAGALDEHMRRVWADAVGSYEVWVWR